mmetsp:Transcript_51372/g.109786  ORF Transcript_51372/g.109786 Transcript_51372/m.109786 type:complete len:114 (-) Transcript_51372:184-525(-)
MIHASGLKRTPTLLKMDVEGFEYAALPALLNAPAEQQPQQIALELHAWHELQPTATLQMVSKGHLRFKSAGELVLFMQTMLFRGRYVLSDLRDMAWALCQYCAEVLFVKQCLE